MINYEDYFESENSPMNELFEEYKQKCMEQICDSIDSEINTIKESNAILKKENKKLRQENQELQKIVEEKAKDKKENDFLAPLVANSPKFRMDESNFLNFLDCLFKKDYVEKDTLGTPIWTLSLTQYYSHKEEVIQLLRLTGMKTPKNIDNFKLPVDWNEEEMDMFFASMAKHCNCNGCIYQRNLSFWGEKSLLPVKEQCYSDGYSEIPWQYVLRNPILKKEKYLKQIGQNLSKKNWCNFEKIQDYLELSEKEKEVILENIQLPNHINKNDASINFIYNNISFVQNKNMLDQTYNVFKNSFHFDKKLLEMPYEYLKQYCKEEETSETLRYINKIKDSITIEQKKELINLAFEN